MGLLGGGAAGASSSARNSLPCCLSDSCGGARWRGLVCLLGESEARENLRQRRHGDYSVTSCSQPSASTRALVAGWGGLLLHGPCAGAGAIAFSFSGAFRERFASLD